MSNIFSNLKLDDWFMVFIYVGGIILVLSLFFPSQWIPNARLINISSGILLIGLGEWKNEKYLNTDVGTGILSQRIRKPDTLGRFFVIIGLILLLNGLFEFF